MRTLLFVPGDRPDRVAKALATNADAVAVDLEDAVVAAAKESARTLVVEALATREPGAPAVYVRINALDTRWAVADLAAVAALAANGAIAGVIVPKVESAEELQRVGDAVRTALLPIVETARGVLAAASIAAVPGVRTLVFGTLDLAGELGVRPSIDGRELLHARSQVVLATAAAGLGGPIEGPYTELDDADGLARSSRAVRELGFTGRVVLHPRQLEPVRAAFSPSAAELARAREVVAAFSRAEADGVGAIRLPDGSFVDRPVVTRAQSLLAGERR